MNIGSQGFLPEVQHLKEIFFDPGSGIFEISLKTALQGRVSRLPNGIPHLGFLKRKTIERSTIITTGNVIEGSIQPNGCISFGSLNIHLPIFGQYNISSMHSSVESVEHLTGLFKKTVGRNAHQISCSKAALMEVFARIEWSEHRLV